MTQVKICGIQDKEHAITAAEAGADFIGMVFAQSPRQVGHEEAEAISEAIKEAGYPTKLVGVFVNMPARQVNVIARTLKLDWIQLSGEEPEEYYPFMIKPIIKAIHIREGHTPADISATIAKEEKRLAVQEHIYLLDTQVKGLYGGTGKTFDWAVAQGAAGVPAIIAGGLNPQNVSQMIKDVSPWGVDVSSGVETNGAKDPAKIKAFIKAVREHDDSKG